MGAAAPGRRGPAAHDHERLGRVRLQQNGQFGELELALGKGAAPTMCLQSPTACHPPFLEFLIAKWFHVCPSVAVTD